MDWDKRFLGWSGSDKPSVFVGACSATPGYMMTELVSGEWHIIVGAYKIPDTGLDVRYEITYTPQRPRWLVGDLHVHSDASDGQHDISTLVKKARKIGLDFIAVANHNNYSENLALPKVPDFTLIPAVEWTHYRGHMNFFGVAAPFENFIANTEEEMLELIAKAKAKGALISVNHPKDPGCPYLWESLDCFDTVEVWNAPMRKSNMDAIAWWHKLTAGSGSNTDDMHVSPHARLEAGSGLPVVRKVPLIGGSDYHRNFHPAMLGHPVTYVYAKSASVADILDALRKGNAYVSATTHGPRLELYCDGAMMGCSVPWHGGLELMANAENLGIGMELQLVTSGGVAHTWRRGQLPARVEVQPGWRFAYLVARRRVLSFQRVAAISNPVYFL